MNEHPDFLRKNPRAGGIAILAFVACAVVVTWALFAFLAAHVDLPPIPPRAAP